MRPPQAPGTSGLVGLAVGVVVIAALSVAREVLIPITLAVLLSFVLGPIVALQRRVGVPRVLAVAIAALLALGVVVLLGAIIGTQLTAVAGDLPRYAATIGDKIEAARSFLADHFASVTHRLANLQQQSAPAAAPAPEPSGKLTPIPVEVHQPSPSPMDLVWSVALPVVSPIATAGIVFVVAVFILLQREDLRDRLIRLFGSDDLHRTTAALDDAGSRLGRYYLSLLAVNTSFGLAIGTGLYFIGIPGPVLWGILAGLLRFVPYIGAFAGAALPVLLGAAIDPSWTKVIEIIALFLAIEPVLGQVIEPLIYGHSTGLSPFSVVISAIFWGWIWGGVGLLLSMPLTLCLVVLGRHIERLQFLDVLLGDRPPLTPTEMLYQRMLAGDARAVLTQAEAAIKEQSRVAFLDDALLPALSLAASDRARGALTPTQSQRIDELTWTVVEDMEEEPAQKPSAPETDAVLCVATDGTLDDAICALLVHLLQERGAAARAIGRDAVSRTGIGALELQGVSRIVLSAIGGMQNAAGLRPIVRRLRGRADGAEIIVGLWSADLEAETGASIAGGNGGTRYVGSLQQALAACVGDPPTASNSAPAPAGSVAESP